MSLIHATPWLIMIATALSAFSIWVGVSMVETKGGSLLLSFVVIAGLFSAWFSLYRPQFAWFIFVITLALAVLAWALFHKLGKHTGRDLDSWREYLRVQGALVTLALVLGGALAWVAVANGPSLGRTATGGQLLRFENLDPSQHPVYQSVDVENYKQISVFTKTQAPANGSATITIYLDRGDVDKLEVSSLDSEPATWSRWDHANEGNRLSLVAESPTRSGAVPATQMDILVFLGPK
jgi:hypothetical protein